MSTTYENGPGTTHFTAENELKNHAKLTDAKRASTATVSL